METIGSRYAIQTGHLLELSAQQLISCDTGVELDGCKGGALEYAFGSVESVRYNYTYMAIIDIHCFFIWAVCLSMCACVRVFLQESITIVNASTYPFESGDGKSHNCKGNL